MKQVTAAIWIRDGKVFIAKRPAGDKLQDKWEFPGGKLEVGETPEECLRREMFEEFGIDVDVGDFFERSIYTYETGCIELLAYFVRCCSGRVGVHAHDEVFWAEPAELDMFDFAPADIPLVSALKKYLKRR
ncbi:MAG: 8-oxo-dGTP diphosphatase MutT [Bacillota bacterium]|nr:8-oxo-dGTP diphosphatase MutT [Bacillota bacterium]MDW7682611.1 8-oxo-dGTP diphosphatase MutT [Bacillota bacterium]